MTASEARSNRHASSAGQTPGRARGALSAAEYAILGLLAQSPAHGYRIAQRFTPGHDLGLLCPMDQSSVYAVLHELARQGMVDGRQELAGARPPRTVFEIGPDGLQALDAWLSEPVEPLRRLRLDFLLKLFLLRRRSPADAAVLLSRQLGVCEDYARRLEEEASDLSEHDFERLVVESKRSAIIGVVDWLRREESRLLA